MTVCDRTIVMTEGASVVLGVGCSDEHEPRELVVMSPAEARQISRALREAAEFVVAPPRRAAIRRQRR